MCPGWDPAWSYVVSCHDWPPAGSGGRPTPGLLLGWWRAAHPAAVAACLGPCGHGCCLSTQGLGCGCILCPSETICHHGKSKDCVSGQTWRGLVDICLPSHLRAVQRHGRGGATLLGGVARGAPCPGPAPCPCWPRHPSPTLAPRAVSPAHRSATNGEPSRQASPRLIGQWGCWGLQDAAYANEAPPIIPGSSVGWSRGNLT